MGIFDDIPSGGGRQGIFDDIPDKKPDGGLLAAAKQGIGQSIKGIGQAASDFIPGVSPQNPISQYGQSVVDANQTAVNSLGGIVDSPWTAVKEAVGNAAGSMGAMLGARVLGTGITAAAPFTGLAAPVVAGAGQLIANVGPIAAAALPSYSGIRETQIAADQGNETDAKSKAIAALGAATVGAIETKFGPQEWALSAMKKGGFSALKDKLGAETLRGAVGKGLVKGAAIEGAEELVQNPIEQLSGYQNPTTPEALQETAFGGAMGAIGGGVVGGGVSGIAHFAERPKGPLQKAAEASSATVPTDAATIPPGGQTSATVPPGAAQPAGIPAGTIPADPETQPPAAGVASADQNTPAAPGISPVPVSTAEPPLLSNQAESAGVPVVDQQAPLSGEYLPASDGRAPFVSAGEIETGAIPGQFSRVYPETGQRRISQTRSITDQSQEGAAKSGNETEIPQPAEPGQQAKPASVSDSARLDWEKDAEALATKAARLREMAARAVGQNRIRLADLAGRMEAAREAIVGQAGATNKDSLTVEGKAPAVTSQSPAAPVQSPAKKSIDLSTRTDAQLTILERNRSPKVRKLAAEEMARRESSVKESANANELSNDPGSVERMAGIIQSSISSAAIRFANKRADAGIEKGYHTPEEAANRKAEAEKFWSAQQPGENVRKIAQAIYDRNPEPLLPLLVTAYSSHQGTARAFEKLTGTRLRGNASAREESLFKWAGWDQAKIGDYKERQEEARIAAVKDSEKKRKEEDDRANTRYLKGREYKKPDGSIISAADLIDQMIESGHVSIEEYKQGAIKRWSLMNPVTNRGIELRDKYEAAYAANRIAERPSQAAAKARKPFVIPTLTTPAQPTTHGAPLEQKAAEIPIGKYAKAEPVGNSDNLPAKSAKLNYDEASTPKEAPNDSADQGGSPSLDQPMAEGQRPDNPIRGAVAKRSRPRRTDDRGVRGAGRRADGSTDESKPLGDGGRSAAVSDGTDGVVAGGVRRVSADFRPGLGALTREGSWFDAAKRNIDLIDLAIQIDKEKRNATTEEQAQLAKYVGFGASEIRNALFPIPGEYAKRLEPNRLVWPNLVRDARWKPLAERIDALPREWQKSILQSTQYAHYTSEGIIRSIWSAIQRLGFTGGNIFEPGTGIGSFSMLMPDGIHETSRFTGVEFDAPTALIARLLSPDQQIHHDDFIKRKFPKNYFDVNVGNPPFSQTKILGDAEYAKHGFMLHDFFFAKGIDLVRPGGLQVFVTSKGTMDKKTDRARKFLSDRADLIGAIRLPSTAFEGNAGTSVVTDVIFLKKRAPGEAPGGMAWGAIKTVDTKDGPVEVNEYFADHPEMILGQQRISGNIDDLGRRVNSNGYGGEKYTVVSYDSTPAELDAKFAEAVERLPENVYSPLRQSDEAVKAETRKVDFDPSVKREGVVYLDKDGAILRVSSGVGVPLDESVKLSDKDRAWLKGYVGIRDLVQSARLAQVTDGDWKAALRALNKAYDAFRAERGPILDFRTQVRKSTDEDGNIVETESRIFKNKRLYREDYDSALLTSLESISEFGEIVKSPFLLGRTIGKPVVVEVKGIGDALAVSLDSIGSLDLADVGRRMGLSMEDTIEALGNQIYRTPAGQWQLADEYLSGDVVTKLEEAEHLARSVPEYRRNVEALKEVQPEKLGPSQISVKLGAAWVPVEHVNEFAKEIGAGHVTFDIKTETWQVEGGNRRTERKAGAEYGTTARSASELLEASLNSRSIKVTAVVDKKTVTDVKATTAANEMAKKIKDKFKRWVWTDSDRASELVEAYNKRFNNIAPRKFDGSHLTLPGVSLRFKLHPHQLRSIWRQIQTGNTYLAHAVGAGKTIEMIAGAMEQKRLGLIKKPMFVVPNHMLEQFSNEFMELYPLANIMVADDENFSAERRKAFVASATLNSPDAIIITHSAFKRIGVTEASVAPIRNEIVTDLEMELASLAKDQGTRVRRSQLEQQIEAVNQRFDAILGASGKDSTIKFEDIGADFIYADEAHAFRKLDFHTAQQIKGIDPNGSQAAMDMYVKTRILERARPGRAFVFASGTPVTNTMGELFTIMRFFAPQEMELSGISTFDSWARQFGEVAPALEPNAAGKYELIERFAKFDNVPELMSRVRQFMDVLTSESLGAIVKRPNLAGGKPNLVVVEPTKALEAYMKGELSRRIEASKAWKPSPGQMSNPDPIVSIITDGRFAAIDPRFFGAELEGESIITKMASNVVAKYHATKGNVYHDKEGNPEPIKGSTQIVFYNLGFGEQSQRSRGFNSRAAFTKLLTDGGIPRDEIAWFDDANTDAKKEAIFKDMRSGKLKVLIGSAKKMGTGVNVQNRLIALHYQDPPWFPADVEQPHGRIIRQGNLNQEVSIDWYTTKGTYQSTMWQMVGRKQRFIDQAFTGDKSLRSMDDMGEASLFEQAAAVASGDPRALQLAGLRQDVERFERLQSAHASEQINIRTALRSAEWDVEHETKRIGRFSKAFKAIGERYFQFDSGAVDGRTYSKTGEFGQALKDAFNRATRDRLMDMAGGDSVQLATIGSAIKITMEAQIDKNKPTGSFSMYVEIMGLQLHVVTAPSFGEETDATGLARKVFNQINSIDSSLRTQRANLATNEADIIRLNKKLGAPFEYQQEMAEKYGELKRLEAELQGDGEKVAVPPSAGKKQGQEQDNQIQQAALSGALPGERQLARYDYQDVMARESGALPGESRFNQASSQAASPADRAVYDMAQEGKSAAEIISFIGKASRRPFNRYLANALKNLGASSTITLDSQGVWRFGNTSRAQKYAAAYNSRTDTVALFTAREAERHILHELVHAATMKAIKAGGTAAVRMRALFQHVQKSGKLNGQYGMSNLDEFVAEAFTNPKFQEALKGVPAPAGSTLKSAWQWFVNIVSRVLGIKTSVARTALDRAMTIGAQLMRENAAGMTANEDTRYAIAWHGTPHVWGPEPGFPHGRPRLDKMGTGEGAQSYGWGWYSAESKSTAQWYADALMKGVFGSGTAKKGSTASRISKMFFDDGTIWTRGESERSISDIAERIADKRYEDDEGLIHYRFKDGSEWIASENGWDIAQAEKYLYQLDIPDDVMPKLLDWDKDRLDQSPEVRRALVNGGLGYSETGKWIYGNLVGLMRRRGTLSSGHDANPNGVEPNKAASEYLASIGIPGLRYLDGTSRNKGEGSYNYVIWDQKVLDRIALLERNGEKLDAIRAAEETRYSLDGSQPFDGREVAATPLNPGTTTLMVDGTERPALNSNGKPIHWSEEGIRNFWRWFGDSKVVGADGRPLVVYHGTNEDFYSFDLGKFGERAGEDSVYVSPVPAIYLASEKMHAAAYGNTLELYVSLKNPKTVDMADEIAMRVSDNFEEVEGDDISFQDIVDSQFYNGSFYAAVDMDRVLASGAIKAKADGYDGVSVDFGDYEDRQIGRVGQIILAFDPAQVKSATGNTGAFSPTDPDIRFSAGADWYNGPSGAPVRNAWQRAKAKAAEILSPKNLDKIIYELQDKHIDLRRLRDHIQAIGGTITDMNDAYLGEELYHKRLAHRTDEFLKAELRPLLAEMKARGVSIQDLETFLHARHAPEANAEMAKRNPNQAEIDAGQKKSATLVLNLEKRLQNAKARGSATVAIEQALNDARGKLLQWNGAQAFRGTEEERRSLSGLSDADAAAIMNGLTPERRAAMDTLAARVDAINEGTLQHLQHYGLMSRESIDTWRKTYRYYVPLHRDEAHPDSANHPIGQGFSVKGDAAKRRTGSNQQVTNILGHIAMQREAALTRGEKNHVMRKLYLMARQNPLPDVWKVGEVPMIDTIDKATGFVRTVPDPLYKTRPNVIMLRIAGKDVAIVMNEHNPEAMRMAQSLKNLDVDDLHYMIPVVGKMTRYFASINTQYNPIFGVINLMRDAQEAALTLSTTELAGKQKEVMTDTLSILKEVLKNKGRMPKTGAWATLFEEFNRVGGTTGYRDLFLDAESRSKSLLDELKALDRGKVSQAWNGVKEWLSDYNEAMENATRLAAYKAALDNGMSKERAASLAKNLTVNFNRKGRQTRELGALYAFFNAAVQGTTRMAQTLAGPAGRKIMAGGVMLGVMNALLGIAAMGGGDGEDDEWEKIPEFIKERSVIIPTGKDSYLSIPMPLGFQFLPNIGRLAVEMAVYKDKTAGKQMVALFQVLADAFNPMGGSSPPMQIAAPTVLDPFVALAQNKDWTGKPIFIENRNSLDQKPGLQRSKDSATPWAKGVAEAINAITGGTKYTPGGWSPTPDQIDFVIGQLTGGIGREAGKVAATATAPFTGEEVPPYKIPLVGRLYGSTAGHSGQSEKFYENITKANEVENEIRGRVRDGISVADYLADHPGAISLAARGNVAERQVAALRKARHAVTMKGGADEVSKVRAINERIANVMRNFNRDADLIGKRSGQ